MTSWRPAWLYALVALILAFLVVPVFIVVPMSFSDSQFLEFPPHGWSLRWYANFIQSPDWQRSSRVSLVAAVATTCVATPLGIAAAYAVNLMRPRIARLAQIVLLLPMMVPVLLVAIGLFYVYIRLGLVNSIAGIVLAHTLLAVPYVVLAVLAGLKTYDLRQEMVARSLGAPRFEAFLRVTLPQIRPAVVSAAFFTFIVSLDETVVGLFVAGGDNMVLTRRMMNALRDSVDPTIAAISTLFILASLVFLGIAAAFSKPR